MSRWKKWLLRVVVCGVALLVVLPLATRWYVRYEGRQHLARITTSLDETDPGWRLNDILATQEKSAPPPDQNIYTVTEAVLAPGDPQAFVDWSRQYPEWLPPAGVANLPGNKSLAAARAARDGCRVEIDRLQTVRGRPSGWFRVTFSPAVLDTKLLHIQRLRTAALLLELSALVAAADKNFDPAVRDCHAILDAAKAVSGEVTLIEFLVRVAVSAIAVGTTERILAWGEPTVGLAELQAAFLAEAEAPNLAYAIRGERAMGSLLFDNLENGSTNASSAGGPGGPLSDFALQTYLPDNHAVYLEYMTAHLTAARQPVHLRKPLVAGIAEPSVRDFRYLLVRLLLPALGKVTESDARRTAQLRSAAVALACEQYRRANGTWPKVLNDIPKDILAAIPTDPYDGRPLRYFRAEDGAIVYSVGPDGTDDGGNLSRKYRVEETGVDYGFRLWDADKRRAASLPEVEPMDGP